MIVRLPPRRLLRHMEAKLSMSFSISSAGIGAKVTIAGMLEFRFVFISFATILERYAGFSLSPLFVSTHLIPMGFLPVTAIHSAIGRFS